ncbi:MAG: DUF3846 domain-containing protein [Chloroflexi bacterium]|nr:DUF3846 domain-containing protein [Chloroflexota bacterium]
MTIRIVLKRPTEEPVVQEIENSLRSFQRLVGGTIECPSLPDGTEFICHEEGKIKHLAPNFYAPTLEDLIVGPALFVRANNETGEYVSLSEAEAEAIIARFGRRMYLGGFDNGEAFAVPTFE